MLSQKRAIAIDTSTIGNNTMVLGIFSIPDVEAAYVYLERHLQLPKSDDNVEFHWSKLNPENRKKVLANFSALLQISSDAILAIKTDALIPPTGKRENILANLIDGCFSGHESTEWDF